MALVYSRKYRPADNRSGWLPQYKIINRIGTKLNSKAIYKINKLLDIKVIRTANVVSHHSIDLLRLDDRKEEITLLISNQTKVMIKLLLIISVEAANSVVRVTDAILIAPQQIKDLMAFNLYPLALKANSLLTY